jgi:hypothetical protein
MSRKYTLPGISKRVEMQRRNPADTDAELLDAPRTCGGIHGIKTARTAREPQTVQDGTPPAHSPNGRAESAHGGHWRTATVRAAHHRSDSAEGSPALAHHKGVEFPLPLSGRSTA